MFKTILFSLFLISFSSMARLHTFESGPAHIHHHHIDGYEDDSGLSGGSSGTGNRLDLDLFMLTKKDLRPSNITNIHQGTKELIVTIDDGPTAGVTDKILDVLKKHKIQATFFVLGSKVDKNQSILKRMVKEGHIVANHSMYHKNIGQISGFFKRKKIREAIIDAHKKMEPYMINSPKWYFRAPYGSWQKRAASIINETEYGYNYYGPLLWDIGGELDATLFKVKRAADWGCWSKGWSVKKCLKGYINETDEKRGGVILFHDLKMESAELIEKYIEHYKAKPDYRFISLDDLNIR
jgi:peptidoglycan/xylan/chitin deacetylase (PgdA/CDA1 family)